MSFLKLDTTILNSSVWVERDMRDVFLTALLMAEPFELKQEEPQLEVRSLSRTGFKVPPGWYGLVQAAGIGITNQALVDKEAGLDALEELGAPDPESRSQDFEGRRVVRINGGYLVLNFIRYRDKDHTNKDRQRRWRERQKGTEEKPPRQKRSGRPKTARIY
jgi:hypothetical protein